MDNRSTRLWISLSMLILLIGACQPPPEPSTSAAPSGAEATLNALIPTLTAQAAVIASSAAVPAGESEAPAPAGQDQDPENPTLTPTATASATPTETSTSTPSVPVVGVSSDTNCRTGPSRYYKLVEKVEPGTRYGMVGKHSPSGYWIIRLEDGRECWLWGEFALPEGNRADLPEYPQPQVGRIEGTVQRNPAADAQKIANAFVDIGLSDFQKYETGNDGFFVFEDVPAGEVNITIQHSSLDFLSTRVIVRTGDLSIVTILPMVPSGVRTPTPTSGCPPFLPRCPAFITPLPAQP